MSGKGLKWTGIGLAIAGAIVSIASGIVSDKKLDNKISEEVAKQLTTKNN